MEIALLEDRRSHRSQKIDPAPPGDVTRTADTSLIDARTAPGVTLQRSAGTHWGDVAADQADAGVARASCAAIARPRSVAGSHTVTARGPATVTAV
jgi:hypothetical protein